MNKNGVTLGPQSAFWTKKWLPFKCKAENHQVGGPEAGSCPRMEVTPLRHNPDCSLAWMHWNIHLLERRAGEGACVWPTRLGQQGVCEPAQEAAVELSTCSPWSHYGPALQPVPLDLTLPASAAAYYLWHPRGLRPSPWAAVSHSLKWR